MARAERRGRRRARRRWSERLRLPRRVAWALLTLAALGALAADWFVTLPREARLAAAVTLTMTYTYALASRSGGRKVLAGFLGLALGVAATLLHLPVLTAGVAAATAVSSALLGVMITTPASTAATVGREVVVALVVAGGGAFGVAGYRPAVSFDRFSYVVLGFALAGSLALVYRLGAGWHGLGRRGVLVVAIGLLLVAGTLAYTEALARWGSASLIAEVDRVETWARATFGAVPRPVAVLLGVPALAWGTYLRARRRQGWWVCAFGVAVTAPTAASLLLPGRSLLHAGLATVYAAVLGLVVGYVVIRLDAFLTGTRGRRARHEEQAGAHRPEPARTLPLM